MYIPALPKRHHPQQQRQNPSVSAQLDEESRLFAPVGSAARIAEEIGQQQGHQPLRGQRHADELLPAQSGSPRRSAHQLGRGQQLGGSQQRTEKRHPQDDPDQESPPYPLPHSPADAEGNCCHQAVNPGLRMPGEELQTHHPRSEHQVNQPAALQGQFDCQKQQRHPGTRPHVVGRHGPDHQETATGKSHPSGQSSRASRSRHAHEKVGSRPGQPEVEEDIGIERRMGGQQQVGQQIEWIENAGLPLGKERKTAVDRRAPQRQ